MPVIFHVEDYEHYKDKKSNFFRVRVEENSVLFVTWNYKKSLKLNTANTIRVSLDS